MHKQVHNEIGGLKLNGNLSQFSPKFIAFFEALFHHKTAIIPTQFSGNHPSPNLPFVVSDSGSFLATLSSVEIVSSCIIKLSSNKTPKNLLEQQYFHLRQLYICFHPSKNLYPIDASDVMRLSAVLEVRLGDKMIKCSGVFKLKTKLFRLKIKL